MSNERLKEAIQQARARLTRVSRTKVEAGVASEAFKVRNGDTLVHIIEGPEGRPGPRGQPGDPGSRGERGPEGPRGPNGPTGPKGRDGSDGNDGLRGKQGPIGPTGERGPIGFVGPEGSTGRDGVNGTDGRDGLDGVDGRSGPKGDKGDPGLPGKQGKKGEKGEKGERGEPGVGGNSGALFIGPGGGGGGTTLHADLTDVTADQHHAELHGSDKHSATYDAAGTATAERADHEVDFNHSLLHSSALDHAAVTVSGVYDYITLVGQDLVRGQVDLTTDVTGVLPAANIDATIARDAEVTSAIAAHAIAADPHTEYVKEADANYVDLTDTGDTTLHTHNIYALDTDLSTHEADTTSIHGIANTANLIDTGTANWIDLTDSGDTTLHIHNIYALDTDLSTHEADTTNIHGIANTAILIDTGNASWIDLTDGGASTLHSHAGGGAHDLLSATHTDTTASAVSRGSLITGQGVTPAWAELNVGTANSVLWTDGVDISWSAAPRLANIADTAGTNRLAISTTGLGVTGSVTASADLRVSGNTGLVDSSVDANVFMKIAYTSSTATDGKTGINVGIGLSAASGAGQVTGVGGYALVRQGTKTSTTCYGLDFLAGGSTINGDSGTGTADVTFTATTMLDARENYTVTNQWVGYVVTAGASTGTVTASAIGLGTSTITVGSWSAGTPATGTAWSMAFTMTSVSGVRANIYFSGSTRCTLTEANGIEVGTPTVASLVSLTAYNIFHGKTANSSKIATLRGLYLPLSSINAATVTIPIHADGPARTTDNDGSVHRMNFQFGSLTRAFGGGDGVISLANAATAPTGGGTDAVIFYSSDDAAGHTVPSFYCEGTNVVATGQADSTSSVRVKMRINGTVRTFLCI